MEYGLALWLAEWAGYVWSGARRTGSLEASQAFPQVPIQDWPRRLMVNRRMFQGPAFDIDVRGFSCVEFSHATISP